MPKSETHDFAGDAVTVTLHDAAAGQQGGRQFDFFAGDLHRTVIDPPGLPRLQSGSTLLDGLFALSLVEVRENSVENIHATAFDHGKPHGIHAFETGELWQYVWTRDLAYAVDLSLAGLDVQRCVTSLMYKTSGFKASVGRDGELGDGQQILQDTGSGGSYPVSTDRVVWALAARRVAEHLNDAERGDWIARTLPILRNTIEQDRGLVFDSVTGLYRGEQSFLDWREQTYPMRTRDNVLAVAMSQSLSTNVCHFIILDTAATWSRATGDAAAAERYAGWATTLKIAINDRLWDADAGQYSAYLLTDQTALIRVHRYDLLGQCLAILAGVADEERGRQILRNYPTGPHGPSVVWPQESTVPIYHNHGIWPFVTAYWIKAARHVGHTVAAAAGVRSLLRATALNVSNMENLDWASGDAHGEAHGLAGPVINSRRQLWSVAAFASMVQDVLFGMETTAAGIRFAPMLSGDVLSACRVEGRELRLSNVDYRGKIIDVTIELPERAGGGLKIAEARLNGRSADDDFVSYGSLAERNEWRIRMVTDESVTPVTASATNTLALKTFTAFANPRAVFAPPSAVWQSAGHHGLSVVGGRVKLQYEAIGDTNVRFNIYRNGQCVARDIVETEWTDDACEDVDCHALEYAVEAVFPETGNHAYPSVSRACDSGHYAVRHIRVSPVVCDAEPVELPFDVAHAGAHAVKLHFSNPNGAVNTGITCAVKKAEVIDAGGGVVGGAYLVLPQTGGEQMVLPSSPVRFVAIEPGAFRLRLSEDRFTINMSFFKHNEIYTGHEGGGPGRCNWVRIDALDVNLTEIKIVKAAVR